MLHKGKLWVIGVENTEHHMVSPHPKWADVEDGYRLGSIGVFVSPSIVDSAASASSFKTGGIPEEQANAYSVSIRTSMGTVSETWDPVANFVDPRIAWEFANLVTHYLAEIQILHSQKTIWFTGFRTTPEKRNTSRTLLKT